MTLIPNFLITGIAAIIIGILVIIWSIMFIERKYGALGLLLLSIITLLFGGGVAFFTLGIIISITATRINKPLTWWHKHLPVKSRKYLCKLWFSSFIISIVLFVFCVLGAIFGLWFLNPNTATDLLSIIGLFSLGLMCFVIICGFAYDIKKQNH